jgi:hypothetical protein
MLSVALHLLVQGGAKHLGLRFFALRYEPYGSYLRAQNDKKIIFYVLSFL